MSNTTSINDSLKGAGLWTGAMALPLLVWLIPNANTRLVLLTLVYPIVMSKLSRNGNFWVDSGIIAVASVITFLVAQLLKMWKPMKDAVEDPDSNVWVAIIFFSLLLFAFGGSIFAARTFEPLYKSSNFI